ncbi:MAG: helix-turn-helix domain-containing protein [Phycisphaerae bacterium]
MKATSDKALLSVKDVAAALSVSQRSIWKLASTGRICAPVRLGRSVRWRADDIAQWVQQGCPGRDKWEAMKGADE